MPGSQSVAFGKAGIWSAIHVCMAIVCACLPALRPLFTTIFDFIGQTTSTIRERSSSLRGRSSKGDIDSDRTERPRNAETIEVLPLRHQQAAYPGASWKEPQRDVESGRGGS
jgi:hypothetical protein